MNNDTKNILQELIIYPVKSCKGIARDEVLIDSQGPDMDRRWMVVDATGACISQKNFPKLAMVHTALDDRFLFLSVPGQTPFMLSLTTQNTPCTVLLENREHHACDMGDSIAKWLSDFLKKECRLVFLPKSEPCPLTFVDRLPLLLISENSLQELNRRLSKRIRMNRFRPNLVVSTESAFAEDNWKRIKIGDVIFRLEKPCIRSIVPGIDQETVQKSTEPLEALRSFRMGDKGILFGQLLVPETTGTIRRGQTITILE